MNKIIYTCEGKQCLHENEMLEWINSTHKFDKCPCNQCIKIKKSEK